METLNLQELKKHFPRRDENSYKYTNGMVFACVGSATYPGAAVLSAKAAMASGAGGVYVSSDTERVGNIILTHLPEAIVLTFDSPYKDQFIERARAFVLGSGQEAGMIPCADFQRILLSQKPVVLDAGGIDKLKSMGSFKKIHHIILTPNIPEAMRLVDAKDISKTIDKLQDFSKETGCTILLKKSEPVIFSLGKVFILNPVNPAATTAGCGDVLAGMIAGFLAQGVKPFYATALGSFLANEAVKLYFKKEGSHTILASEIIRFMSRVLLSYVP